MSAERIEIECPVCSGRGKVVKDDPLARLAMIYVTLSEYDKREVLLYAEYLKQRRRQRERSRSESAVRTVGA